MAGHDFWKSAGLHLLARTAEGRLQVTPDFVRAYLTRPEVHPIETSCAEEIGLHEALMADPFRSVAPERIARMADKDAVETYRIVLAFRDALAAAGTVEGAYLQLVTRGSFHLPPVFLDQLVHVILRNVLAGSDDAFRVKAAEIFFRAQRATADAGRLMLADEEIVEMHAQAGSTPLGKLLAESGTPLREVALDVLTEESRERYWSRSDRFDMVVDFRFGTPAQDGLARVIEGWLAHLLAIEVRVQPVARIDDPDWRWHIGLDREATRLLNKLYAGEAPSLAEMTCIVALYRMHIRDDRHVIDRVRGRPIYLGLAMDAAGRVRMKPQNLLVNLPLRQAS